MSSSDPTYMRFCAFGDQLIETNIKLCGYNGKSLDVEGVTIFAWDHMSHSKHLPVVVIRGEIKRPSLMLGNASYKDTPGGYMVTRVGVLGGV